MNPLSALQTFVDTAEKLYTLPPSEVLQNGELVEQMRKAISAHNIDGIINGIMNDFTQTKTTNTVNEAALLHAYAKKEATRLDNGAKPYVTEIINASDKLEGDLKKPSRKALAAFNSFFNGNGIGKTSGNSATAENSVYANGALKINTPSDPSLLMSYIDYSPYRVNYSEYLSVPTLSEMVDRPIAMALKKFPKIKSSNKNFSTALEKAFKKAKVPSVIKDAIFYSVLSPRGSLVVPIKRGDEVTFNVFNDTQFAYGMGSSYSGVTAPYSSVRVGELHCMGARLTHGVSAFFMCPGYEPLFGVGINRVPQLRAAAEAWNLYVHVLKILLVRAQVIIERMDGDIQTDTMLSQMRAQLQRLSQTMGVSTPVAQARGATLDILNNNISEGTSSVAGVFRDFVASVTGLSPEYFFGGGNTNYSQAAFQIASTNENIRARYQIGQIEPLLRFIVNTLIRNDAHIGALGVADDDFEIEFESIYEETEQEKADLIAKKTDILIKQCDYAELEQAFKQLDLLPEEVTFSGLEPRAREGGEGEEVGGEGKSVLNRPLA